MGNNIETKSNLSEDFEIVKSGIPASQVVYDLLVEGDSIKSIPDSITFIKVNENLINKYDELLSHDFVNIMSIDEANNLVNYVYDSVQGDVDWNRYDYIPQVESGEIYDLIEDAFREYNEHPETMGIYVMYNKNTNEAFILNGKDSDVRSVEGVLRERLREFVHDNDIRDAKEHSAKVKAKEFGLVSASFGDKSAAGKTVEECVKKLNLPDKMSVAIGKQIESDGSKCFKCDYSVKVGDKRLVIKVHKENKKDLKKDRAREGKQCD